MASGGAKLVVERDAAILRCRAVVEACRDEGILLLARTDARVSRGFDEALARIQAFVAEGAHIDATSIAGTPEQCRERVEAYRRSGIDVPLLSPFARGARAKAKFEALIRACAPSADGH